MLKVIFENKKMYLAVLIMMVVAVNFLSGCDIDDVFGAFEEETYGLNIQAVEQTADNYYWRYYQPGIVSVNNEFSTTSYYWGEFEADQEVVISATPAENFEFVGWYTAYEGGILLGETPDYTFVMPRNYVEFYARFERIGYSDIDYTVTFDPNGGMLDPNFNYIITVNEGDTLGELMPANPTRQGFEFVGWRYNYYNVYPYYEYDYNADGTVEGEVYDDGETTATSPNYEGDKEGYYYSEDGEYKEVYMESDECMVWYPDEFFTAETVVLDNLVVYAEWKFIEYVSEASLYLDIHTLESDLIGGYVEVIAVDPSGAPLFPGGDDDLDGAPLLPGGDDDLPLFEFPHNVQLVLEAAPYEGFEFVGYFKPEVYNLISSEARLEMFLEGHMGIVAKFRPVQEVTYTLKLDANGGHYENGEAHMYFDNLESFEGLENYLAHIPVKPEYDFVGWSVVSHELIQFDATTYTDDYVRLYAIWESVVLDPGGDDLLPLSLTLDANGGHFTDTNVMLIQLEFETETQLQEYLNTVPYMEGYDFVGWSLYENEYVPFVVDSSTGVNAYMAYAIWESVALDPSSSDPV